MSHTVTKICSANTTVPRIADPDKSIAESATRGTYFVKRVLGMA